MKSASDKIAAAREALEAFDKYAESGAPVAQSVGAAYGLVRELLSAVDEVTPEPEWEWACRDETRTSHFGELYNVGQPESVARREAKVWGDTLMRRRPAGPWEVSQ